MRQVSMFDAAPVNYALMDFVEREAVNMWDSEEHRKRSIAQVRSFARFSNNASRPLSQFLPRDIHDWRDALVDDGVSKSTANRYLASVSKVFNHAVDERVIKSAPRIKFYRVKSERVRYFSDTEIDQITSYFTERGDDWMTDMFVLALKTGMRKGEIIALGEGRASVSDCGDWIYLPPEVTKTNKGRNVPISNPVANAAAHRIVRDLMQHYTKKKFEHRWNLVKREYARTDDTYVFHVTRHNAASRMANELQVPTVIVAEMLGHSSLSTTQRYVHAKSNTMRDISMQM
jgi:integrase